MMKQPVGIYPYSQEFTPILRYLARNPEVRYIPVSPHGFAEEGEDAGIDGCGAIGLAVTNQLDDALSECKTLIIADGNFSERLRHNANKAALAFASEDRLVFHFMQTSSDIRRVLEELSENCIRFYTEERLLKFDMERVLFQQKAIVIGIGSIFPGIDNTNVLLSLKQNFEQRGLRTEALLSTPQASLVKAHRYPDEVVGNKSISDQILQINHFIETIERTMRPDVLLVQYPGGMQLLDNEVCNDLGEYSYVVSQAVKPDYFICCFPYANYPLDYVGKLSEAFLYKFNTEIHCALLSDKAVHVPGSHEENELVYYSVGHETVEQKVAALDYQNQSMWCPLRGDMGKLANHIFESLQ